jgi:arsenite methyltransferase
MTAEVEIDVEVLKTEIKKTYASVSQEPEKDFIFPTGRAWAEDLDYPEELANVPETAVGSFAGVGTHGSSAGSRRVSGCSTLARAPAPTRSRRADGRRTRPRHRDRHDTGDADEGARRSGRDGRGERRVRRERGGQLPFADASFDVVISNGVIDLIPDKDAVFAEIFRVLAPGGRIQIADVTIQNPVSAETATVSACFRRFWKVRICH